VIKCEPFGIKIELPFPDDTGDMTFGLYESAAIEGSINNGGWEQCERARVKQFLPDAHIIEFGGGTGFMSCFANKLIKDKIHLVYEPNPFLIPIIQHNAELNGVNIKVINKAYGVTQKVIDFKVRHPGDAIVSLCNPVTFRIETISLKEILEQYSKINEYTLLIDVEGSETELIYEAEALKKCKTIIIDMHRPGFEAGGEGFAWVDVNKFFLGQGFTLKDRCWCTNWVGVYVR
jgi:FkbM family methyltransferase